MKPMNYAKRLHQRVTATAEWILQKTTCSRFGLSPASGLGTVLVLASLTLVSGPVQAFRPEAGVSICTTTCASDCDHHVDTRVEAHVGAAVRIGNVEVSGEWHNVVPVPRDGLGVKLWSDPDPDDYIEVGDRARFYFEANADCYVTLVSIGTDGRARRLFPGRGDGYVRGGKTYALPNHRSDYDLRFAGPAGEEYVFAVASLYPIRDRFPRWMDDGVAVSWRENYWDDEDVFWRTGWSVGDPIHDLYDFVDRVVRYPRDYESYAASWLRFDVGWQRPDCWLVCNVCGHSTIWGDKYCDHRNYVSVTIDFGSGHCDFRHPPKRRWVRRWYSPRNPHWKTHKYRYTREYVNPDKPGHVVAPPTRRSHVERRDEKPQGWDRVKGKRHVDDWLADADDRKKRDRDDRGANPGDKARDRDDKDRDRSDRSRDRGGSDNDRDRDDDRTRDINRDRVKIEKSRGATEIQKSIRRDSRDLAAEETRRAQERVKVQRPTDRNVERKADRKVERSPQLTPKSQPTSQPKRKEPSPRSSSKDEAKKKSEDTSTSRASSEASSKSNKAGSRSKDAGASKKSSRRNR